MEIDDDCRGNLFLQQYHLPIDFRQKYRQALFKHI